MIQHIIIGALDLRLATILAMNGERTDSVVSIEATHHLDTEGRLRLLPDLIHIGIIECEIDSDG